MKDKIIVKASEMSKKTRRPDRDSSSVKETESKKKRRDSAPAEYQVFMGGEVNVPCINCGLLKDAVITCENCKLSACAECSARKQEEELVLLKELGLEWTQRYICCTCLKIAQWKSVKGK